MIGSASSVAFSFDVMHPAAFRRFDFLNVYIYPSAVKGFIKVFLCRIFGPFDTAVANALWFNAHIGIGVYLYTRRHMKPDCKYHRIKFV